jgi:SAM-dependent methyltransferase
MRTLDLFYRLAPSAAKLLIRLWYQHMSRLDRDAEMVFMNYGYAATDSSSGAPVLNEGDERDRFCIQLYHHVAGSVDLEGRDVLEVGCGRGGGASYIARYLRPGSMTGVDVAEKAVSFCSGHHTHENLSFRHGDAEALPFPDNSFDAVVNVESSHCYGSMRRFLDEVYRCLRPDGHFLFADRRDRKHVDIMRGQLRRAGFNVVREENITRNILRALDLDDDRKVSKIDEGVPWLFRKAFKQFAATRGTSLHRAFQNQSWEYMSFVLSKNGRGRGV